MKELKAGEIINQQCEVFENNDDDENIKLYLRSLIFPQARPLTECLPWSENTFIIFHLNAT